MNVLFLCTGNSCRSVLSEGTFNHLAPAGMKAISAGSQPAGALHPRAVALLHRKGISTEGYYSKSWDDLPVVPDIVVTVCSSAAGETCPAYLGPVLRRLAGSRIEPMTRSLRISSDHFSAQTGWQATRPAFDPSWFDAALEAQPV